MLTFFFVFVCKIAKEEREIYLKENVKNKKYGVPPHEVKRENIYRDVIDLYRDQSIVYEEPFCVRFQEELAVDVGGVTREMFSAFFIELYVSMFDGPSMLYPAVHSSIKVEEFEIIGTIFSHAYLISGILPDRIAFPCIAAIFLGPTIALSDNCLHHSFVASLNIHEASLLNDALQLGNATYSDEISDGLTSIFSLAGCRETANARNIERLIIQSARYRFIIKPAAALMALHKGIPKEHALFWASISVDKLRALYDLISVTHGKVLKLLIEPEFLSMAEERVWQYLRQFIGNLTIQQLRSFLRFVTGSFVISVYDISVTFNKLEGLARRPISHTCTSTLELSTSYCSLIEFTEEFLSVITNPQYCWEMDCL